MGGLRRWVPEGYATSMVSMPHPRVRPLRELGKHGLLTLVLLMISTLVVWLDRDSYADNIHDGGVSFIDALYYSTITMTTTGYSDITPLTPRARLLGAILIAPTRVDSLVLLVGTTIAVLTDEGSCAIRNLRWRQKMRNHVAVISYSTKGRNAINTLRHHGEPDGRIVVIGSSNVTVSETNLDGLAVFLRDGTCRDLLWWAEVPEARKIIICLSRGDAAILTTLTARQLNPGAGIVVDIRKKGNVALVHQSGVTSVVASSDTVGRLLDLSAVGPELGAIIQDLLTAGTGLEVQQRQARLSEVGQPPNDVKGEQMIGIIRNGTLRRFCDSAASRVRTGGQLIIVRRAERPDLRDTDG